MKQKILPPILFAAMAGFLLLAYYSDMLFTAQWRTPFMTGAPFRDGLLAEPFGLLAFGGCWLTQTLYHPALGVAVYLALWLASWVVGTKALRLGQQWSALMMLPLGCLVLSLTGVGYMIYSNLLIGYWFSQSLGYLLCLATLWGLGSLGSSIVAQVVQAVVCLALYPLLGWYTYLLALCLVLKQRNWWCLLALLAPALWRAVLYDNVSMYVLWQAGFPLFRNTNILVQRPIVPFYLLAAFTLVLAAPPWRRVLSARQWGIGLSALTLLTATGVWCGSFKDYNYLAEMRMTRSTMDGDWKTVLDEAKRTKHPSRTMVALKNVALMNTGRLGERSFALSNDGRDITNPDSLTLNIMQIAAPLVYYNYGMTNFAERWCIENSVSYGYSPYYLQLIARCAKASGEEAMVQRTVDLLRTHAWYGDWQPGKVPPVVHELRTTFANVIDSDRNSCEFHLIDIFSQAGGSGSPLVEELHLFYAMLYGTPGRFWPAFVEYTASRRDELLPQHFQEAYFFFMDSYPVELPFKVNVASLTYDRYKAFKQHYAHCCEVGADKVTAGEAMRAEWAGTFWWHHYFGRNSY